MDRKAVRFGAVRGIIFGNYVLQAFVSGYIYPGLAVKMVSTPTVMYWITQCRGIFFKALLNDDVGIANMTGPLFLWIGVEVGYVPTFFIVMHFGCNR